jgi:deazaflavin-dependent oxidoreductase (nitroreductase family)
MATSALALRVMPKVVPHIDRVLGRLTRGRVMSSSLVVPSIVLTTTGAKSGLPRPTPLAAIPLDGHHYVVGSNFGGERHPAWSYNLIAHPEATLTHRGQEIAVRAELLGPQDKAAVWPRLTAVWPPFDTYVEHSGRDLRVFRLTQTPTQR